MPHLIDGYKMTEIKAISNFDHAQACMQGASHGQAAGEKQARRISLTVAARTFRSHIPDKRLICVE